MPHAPETIPVADYYHDPNSVEYQLDYPGKRPEGSFITDGETVTLLPETHNEFVAASDAILGAQDLPLIKDRFPVLAYGANASPGRLAYDKLSAVGANEQPLMQTVPHIMAILPNTAAVWHGRTAQKGSVFAEIYGGEHAEGINLKAHVAFLTKEQLAVLHNSEGMTYSAAELPATLGEGDNASEVPVLAYVALKSHIAHDETNKPILVGSVKHEGGELQSMAPREMVAYMLKKAGVDETPEEFVQAALNTKRLADKKARQAEVGDRLTEAGVNQPFAFVEASSDTLIGRADFASIPGSKNHELMRTPEMVLTKIRATEEEIITKSQALKRQEGETDQELRIRAIRLIDPARKLSRRAHEELSVRTGLPTVEK